MKRWFLQCLLLLFTANLQAAPYLIYFKDKPAETKLQLSNVALQKRYMRSIKTDEKDLPVSGGYVFQLGMMGIHLQGQSRWLNAVLANLSQTTLEQVKSLDFVAKVVPLKKAVSMPCKYESIAQNMTALSSNRQLSMLDADALHQAGYSGEGMIITVLDNGFTQVDKMQAYAHLFSENRILHTRNFTDPSRSVFGMGTDGDHGSRVLSTMAALIPPYFSGIAYRSSFILGVTEDMTREGVLEEWNWLMAAEWADSLGTDIISTSLGYAVGFTYGTNHRWEEFDGHSTLISQAANLAASRGILVVNAAGNEGETPWQKLIAPADADSCMAVGAVNAEERYAGFSSMGPTYDGRIKPDIVTMGQQTVTLLPQGFLKTGNGTSFACPLAAGFSACLWPIKPQLSNMDLFGIIRDNASHAAEPDTFTGYGIPRGKKIFKALTQSELPTAINLQTSMVIYPNPGRGSFYLSYYHYGEARQTQVSIYSSMGQLIMEFSLEVKRGMNTIYIDLNTTEYAQGLYYLYVRDFDSSLLYENKILLAH